MSNKAIKLEQAQTLYGDMRTRHETFKGAIAPEYSNNSTYAAGARVIYGDSLYKCTTAISVAEEWTPAHWTQVTLDGDIGDTKADKTDTILNTTLSRGRANGSSVGEGSFAFGDYVEASGTFSSATGSNTIASGMVATAEGARTIASGAGSHAEGATTEASAMFAHAEGNGTLADVTAMHAMGIANMPEYVYPEWVANTAYNVGDCVVRYNTGYRCKQANSDSTFSFAKWDSLTSIGTNAYPDWKPHTVYNIGDKATVRVQEAPGVEMALGLTCIVAHTSSDTFDESEIMSNWNVSTKNGDTAFVIGNGNDDHIYSNAMRVKWNGDAIFSGDVYVNADYDSTGGTMLPRDVQINGTSIVSQGVADIPLASSSVAGVVKPNSTSFYVNPSTGAMQVQVGTAAQYKSGASSVVPVVASQQHASVFYGLAKAAGDSTQSASDNVVGTYTEDAKSAIKSMLGVNVNDVQINSTSVVNQGIANIPLANSSTFGAVKLAGAVKGSSDNPGAIYIAEPSDSSIKNGVSTSFVAPISKQHAAVFYGLAKAAGDSTQSSSSNVVGTYTDDAKTAIQTMLGVSSAADVALKADKNNAVLTGSLSLGRTEGSSVGNNSIALGFNTVASGTYSYAEGVRTTASASGSHAEGIMTKAINNGTHAEGYSTIASGNYCSHAEGYGTTAMGDSSHSEGLYSVSGSNTTHTEGRGTVCTWRYAHSEGDGFIGSIYVTGEANATTYTYTNEENVQLYTEYLVAYRVDEGKATSVRSIDAENHTITFWETLGSACSNTLIRMLASVADGESSHGEGIATVASGIAQHVSGMNNAIDPLYPQWAANTHYNVGDRIIHNYYGYECNTENTDSSWTLAHWNSIKHDTRLAVIVGNGAKPGLENRSNAYALDWEGNEYLAGNVYVGCNNDSTGGTILPKDVQINGTSIVASGVANIPIAGTDTIGTVKIGSSMSIGSSGALNFQAVGASEVKAGTSYVRALTPERQHASVFYGLAKAAGVDMASSSNAVGTYTDAAKAAIKTMLGIQEVEVVRL